MRDNRTHKVNDQTDARSHPQEWPSDPKNQPRCPSKLASGQEWKILQRHANNFVDYVKDLRVAVQFPKSKNAAIDSRTMLMTR